MGRLETVILVAALMADAPCAFPATVPLQTTNVPPNAIVVDGQPAASIVLRPNPSDREKQAAREILSLLSLGRLHRTQGLWGLVVLSIPQAA